MDAPGGPGSTVRGHESDRRGLFSPSTGRLAFVGATIFASGFFLLAAAGQGYGPLTLVLILAGAAILTLPILALALVVAGTESIVGRAWASGFHALSEPERRGRGLGCRGLRYAGFLWLANGGALWFATIASRI